MTRLPSLVVLCGVAVVLFGGCATRNAIKAPTMLAEQFGRGDAALNRTSRLVDIAAGNLAGDTASDEWWTDFEDPRLTDLVGQVLAANQDLLAAGLRLQRAWLAAGLATDNLLPQASASASVAQSRSVDGAAPWTRSSGATLALDYELDLRGRLRAQRSAATWEATATEQDLASTRLSLIGTACSLYWTLGYLNQRVELGTASTERLERTLALVRTQQEAGATSRLELREAEQSLRTAERQQSELVQQRVETRNSLTELLGGQTWPAELEPSNLEGLRAPVPREGMPAELLERRPDLRASAARLQEALAYEQASVRAFFPQITLTGSVGTASDSLTNILTNPVATLGAGLTLPFLQWNRNRLNRATSHVDTQLAITDFRKALFTAFTEVDNALSNGQQLTLQLDAATSAYLAAEEVDRLYEIRYRSGATALRTWLDAQETRRNAELAVGQTRLAVLQNSALLFQALGGR